MLLPHNRAAYCNPSGNPCKRTQIQNLRDTEMLKVLLVDDDENLLSSVSDFLELVAGVQCLKLSGMNDLIKHEAEACKREVVLAIVDINLGAGRPSGIDVHRWLREHSFPGTIAFLTGHATDHPLVGEATRI